MRRLSETAHLVAMYRALETERSNALFRDPFARRLAGGRGEMLVEILGNPQQNRTAIALRTSAIDQMLQQVLATQSSGTVLSLAAGFDTRPYRLDLPASLRWIEVDLPEVLQEKACKLKHERSRCQLERIELDITNHGLRNTLFQQINAAEQPVLVLAEGLLVYLSEAQVRELAEDLANYSSFRRWLFEIASPTVLQFAKTDGGQQRFDQYFAQGKPSFLFAPEAGADFFQPYGWTVSEFRSIWQEVNRSSSNRWRDRVIQEVMRHFAKQHWQALNQSGFVLLERSCNRQTNSKTAS